MEKTKPFCKMTPDEYYDFLWSYTTFDKTREQLIEDLEITEEEEKYGSSPKVVLAPVMKVC